MALVTAPPAIDVSSLSKRFRSLVIPKQATLKEAIVNGTMFARREHVRFIQALQDVSFSVPTGTTLGVIGKNGSGKSTLLRILAGVIAPDAGGVTLQGHVAPLLSLGVGFHPDLTGRENAKISGLILGLHPDDVESRMQGIIDFAELGEFIDTPVRMYSTGMYMRLAFSVAVTVDPDILLLDEIFAVGDATFTNKCNIRMREFRDQGKTMVLVSHDMSKIASFCDVTLWLEKGRVVAIGPSGDVVSKYNEVTSA